MGSDRISKSKEKRNKHFEFNTEDKFKSFDKNVDSKEKCALWVQRSVNGSDSGSMNKRMNMSNIISVGLDNNEINDDELNEDKRVGKEKMFEGITDRKSCINTENKYEFFKSDSSSDTSSEESGRTYQSS